jgi:hypothetical protein
MNPAWNAMNNEFEIRNYGYRPAGVNDWKGFGANSLIVTTF